MPFECRQAAPEFHMGSSHPITDYCWAWWGGRLLRLLRVWKQDSRTILLHQVMLILSHGHHFLTTECTRLSAKILYFFHNHAQNAHPPSSQNTIAPPSTMISVPFIYLPALLTSVTSGPVISHGCPILPIGFLLFHVSLAFFNPSPSFKIVSI